MRTTVHLCVLLIGSLVAQAILTTPTWSQPALDPQSLVGEWGGSWAEKDRPKIRGQYYLWIEKVEGNKVHGRAEVSNHRRTKFNFVGTLDGNRLTFGRGPTHEFLIEADQMRGGSRGANARDIILSKRK